MLKLMSFTILDVLDNVISKVTGIGVEWIYQVIGEINARRDHFGLLYGARLLRIQLEEL